MTREQTQHIIERLAEKRDETLDFFRTLAPEDWKQQVYTTGPEWDARQVLCHFVSAERGFSRIFAQAMNPTESPPDKFDIDDFNLREVGLMADMTPAQLVDHFEETRASTIAFVESLSDADLERDAWHPWFNWDKLGRFLKLVYRHNMMHERDVRKAIETKQPVPHSGD